VIPADSPIRNSQSEIRNVQIGTSGWNYKHWAGGRFYPPRLAASRWLEFFSRRFHTVEVNNSFYNVPSAESMKKWSRTVPAGFTFALKMWRGITHYRKLHHSRDLIERFFAFAGELPVAQRAPLLVQLPPHFTVNLPRLDEFFQDLRSVLHGARWQVAVEFRHDSWLTPAVYKYLEGCKAAVALSDHGRCLVGEPNDAPFVYVRRHGKNYDGSYTTGQIAADAALIRRWTATGKQVYVYYNNDIGGHALDNARQLMSELGIQPPQPAVPDALFE
jgi:uncharacterized protein YecE (DUF72 family)